MKPSKTITFFSLILLLWANQACIEPFIQDELPEAKILVIESFINDNPKDQQYITIKYSRAQGLSVFDEFQSGAAVYLLSGSKIRFDFTEKLRGYYYLPSGFKPIKGETYQLFFEINSQKYASTLESLPPSAPKVDKVYQKFEPNTIPVATNSLGPGHNIYIDYKDDANLDNFYSFKWTLWETQYYCKSCAGGEKYQPSLGCVKDPFAPLFLSYDYSCASTCWEIITSKVFNINDDRLINGKNSIGKLVGQIPYYQNFAALLRVDIQSISKEFYKYQNLVAQQSQNSGGLADTPPAPIVGNIRNLSTPSEPIVGYFALTSSSNKLYKFIKDDALGYIPFTLLDHTLQLEPASPFRPPLAPCVESPSRTKIEPEGW
jgi:hypothetical protein